MNELRSAVDRVREAQKQSGKPFAVVLAGHNGSGKSTMWYKRLAEDLQIPLVNADRMMLSILPETTAQPLPDWARTLRDNDTSWAQVAQKGVEAFVAQAMARSVPFAMETVFSHWHELENGKVESKIDLIKQMQKANYFVLLMFVGLSSSALSVGRVMTRVGEGGHDVDAEKLEDRFPRTQKAIGIARGIADAAILVDNSRGKDEAFTVCHVQLQSVPLYDMRDTGGTPPEIAQWLEVVVPKSA